VEPPPGKASTTPNDREEKTKDLKKGASLMPENSDFVNYFQTNKLHLIRIAKSGHDAGKRPHDTGWQKTPLDYSAARSWFESGGNLGWCVGPSHLVLDIDPRNGGDESFDSLLADLSLDPKESRATTPVVITGGGGRHVYLKRDPSLPIRPGPLRGYPGIDIKTGPSQVVIPGSIHPSGLPYAPDKGSLWPQEPVVAPAVLTDMLARRASPSQRPGPLEPINTKAVSALEGCLSVEQCTALLMHNDPTRLESYEQWISRLAAIHHATGGDGLDLAIQWSSKDPKYSEVAEAQVRRRWRSFDSPHEFPATVNTLIADVRQDPKSKEAVAAVGQVLAQAEFDDLAHLERELSERVDSLPGGGWKANQVAIKNIILESLNLDEILQTKLHKRLAKEVGERFPIIQKYVSSIRRAAKEDKKAKKDKVPLHAFIITVRDKTIQHIKDAGRCIVRAPNEQYYIYNGQYWEAQSREYVTSLVHKSTHELMAKSPDLTFETTGTTSKAEKSLCSEVFVKSKELFFRDEYPSVINTTSGTVWIDNVTGDHEIKPHYPGDYLTTQIKTPYDPEATCPSFDTMLDQVFGHIADDFQRAEMVRHFWELVGYVIQPHKNIPLIMLWYGGGHNGKTTISKFLSELVGPMCAQPVEMHDLGSGKDSHALESLEGKLILIDDDLKSDAKLSDGTLKKFSESKLVLINPKHKAKYSALINVTPIILTNGYPIIRDLSKGLQRRMDVMPFESDLSRYKDSRLPRIARESEMSGLLNRALEGLKRLRARGDFDRPQSSLDASSKFFCESNNVAAFIQFSTSPHPGSEVSIVSLYSSYVQFCIALGERNQIERQSRFKSMVAQLGYEIRRSSIFGIVAKLHEDDY